MVILLLEVEVGVDPPFRILFPRSKRNINSSVPWCVNAETITPATERGWNFIRCRGGEAASRREYRG